MTSISSLSRPLAAFHLGYALGDLRRAQTSVWATAVNEIRNVRDCLYALRQCELVFVDQLGDALHQEYQVVLRRIQDRHESAARLGGAACRDQKVLRQFQTEDWDTLLLLNRRVVDGNPRCQSWFAVSHAMVETLYAAHEQDLPTLEAEASRLLAAVATMPPEDREVAECYLPKAYSPETHEDPTRWGLELADACGKLRKWLVEHGEVPALLGCGGQAASSGTHPPTIDGIAWSKPDRPSQWARVFGVSHKTIIKRLKEGTIRNKKLSERSYQVAMEDLPNDYKAQLEQKRRTTR